ncbi:MAG: hypothetical protein ACFE8U_12845 [Candidatus Hermodarchaeota archaeon]
MVIKNHFFFMCPPFEIAGKRKLTVVAKRGYFEISQNQIKYKYNELTNFIALQPLEGLGQMTELPSSSGIDAYQILYSLFDGIAEICFFPESVTANEAFLYDFIYGDLLPFSYKEFGPGFYRLKKLHPNIYEEFYRLTTSLEDSITTSIATFEKNVFIPFKQKVISTFHTDKEGKEEKSKTALQILSRDFPRFLSLHQNLTTILNAHARQITDYQQVSMTILSPLLRKIRILNTIKEYMTIEPRKKGIDIRMSPKTVDTTLIAERITPLVQP